MTATLCHDQLVPLSKQRVKQSVRRVLGEPYVGKRLKQIRLAKALAGLSLAPSSILDAGSEDATFVYWLADRYPTADVTAIDIDEAAIAACTAARPRSYANRVSFKTLSFGDLPESSFDLITILDVFEHIADDAQAAADLARALKPGGTLIVHVPRDQWRTFRGETRTMPDEEAWKIQPGHVRVGYSPEGIAELLASAGLQVDDVETWLGRWGVLAHQIYRLLERPAPLRLLTIPVTVAAAHFEAFTGTHGGNTVYARATKPAVT